MCDRSASNVDKTQVGAVWVVLRLSHTSRNLEHVLDQLRVLRPTQSPILLGKVPCGFQGCKNGPAPFPGRMSYKATKPGSVCQRRFFLSVSVVLLTIGPLFALLFCVICVFCLLVVLVRLSVSVQVIDRKDSSPK